MKDRYKNIKLHDYIIMPNRIYRIIEICDMQLGAGIKPAPTFNYIILLSKSFL